jgi:ubiquinone/menaquinone biosynthesis C-methylase UbiE
MWEEYYSVLGQLPDWLKRPVPFIVEASSLFKKYGAGVFLDLGCGVGRNSIYLAKEGFDVVAIDISISALKKTKTRSKIEGTPNVTVLRASMTNLPFVSRTLDAVISISVIHHALREDIEKAIEEIQTVLKDNGLFLANLLSKEDYRHGSGKKIEEGTFLVLEMHAYMHQFEEVHHFFSKKEILTLLAGFKRISIEPIQSGKIERPHTYWKVISVK